MDNDTKRFGFWRPGPEDEARRIENENKIFAAKWEQVRDGLWNDHSERLTEIEQSTPSLKTRCEMALGLQSPRRRRHTDGLTISAAIGNEVDTW